MNSLVICPLNGVVMWIMQVTTQFLKLETLLDDNVDHEVELQIERGGTSLTINIVVRFYFWIYLFIYFY